MSRDGPVDPEKRATLRQFAALGAVGPLARFVEEREDDGDTRGAIAGYVATTPGAHFSKIRDDLKLGTGETQHHLKALEDAGAVESRRDGDYRRFFPADQFSPFEQVALGYLRRETPRGMLLALLSNPDLSGSALASHLDVSGATVSTYAADLEEAGLLAREDGYAPRRPETLITLIVRYANSFDAVTAEFADRADQLVTYDP